MKRILEIFKNKDVADFAAKDAVIVRLLEAEHITAKEALILTKAVTVNINTENFEMSSGAKILGGSDFEQTSYPR